MKYFGVPNEITNSEILGTGATWSPGMYRRVLISTNKVKKVRDLLRPNNPFEIGDEPGSLWYMNQSTHYFIRNKALQSYSNLLYPKGEAITPINPRAFVDRNLTDGDILISKDSNIGECVMVHGDQWKNHMFSGGIVRLHPIADRYYLFSFLKHPIFKTQLYAMSPRGATITHAGTRWLDCLIPFPNQSNADEVIKYVSSLTQAIIEKEIAIRERSEQIDKIIETELVSNQKSNTFRYEYPNSTDIMSSGRFDAAIYSKEYH